MNIRIPIEGALNLVTKRFLGPFWIRRKWLDKTQWYAKEQLEQIQLKLLKRLVKHCYASVPYYRQFMDKHHIHVNDIKTLEDIKLFPVLTKAGVLEARHSMLSTRYPSWLVRTGYTGGTTGTALPVWRDLFSIGNEHAFVRRQFDWAGLGLRDKCAYLTGRCFAKPDSTDGLFVYDPFMKELVLSTYHLSAATAKQYAQLINDYKIKALMGYASAAFILARTCLDDGIKVNLKSVMTCSETLNDSMKKTIIDAFNCKVFNFYGSAERVCYIFACEKGGLHIIPEYGLTELVPIDGPAHGDDRRCRVISTGFWNLAMPFIRYELGDIIVKSNKKCSCGREMEVVESIQGRGADVLHTPSGRQLGPTMFTHILYGTQNITESQIIQDSLGHIIIEYVPGNRFSQADWQAFRQLITKHLPTELKIDIKQVKAVKRTSSGKIRPIVSKIAL